MVNKISTIKERVVLLAEHKGVIKEDFFKKVGVTSANFRGKAKNTPLNSSAIENIFSIFPDISLEWLLTGAGKMYQNDDAIAKLEKGHLTLKDNKSEQQGTALPQEKEDGYRLVPLVNMEIVGKVCSISDIPIPKSQCILKMVPFLGARESDICFPVTGNGIYPAGSIVLAREVEDWRKYFGYGSVYCILLKDGRTILKEIQKHDESPQEYLLCKNQNTSFAVEELPRNMIAKVWRVVKVLLEVSW
jgi:hypothetical protein